MEYSLDEGVDREIRDILANLKFIAKWADANGKKLNLAGMKLVDDTWWNSLWRTLGGVDSRELAYKFIVSSVNKALDATVKYYADPAPYKRKVGDMILDHLREAKPGIKSSSAPYAEDMMLQSKVETFLLVLDARVADIERRFGVSRVTAGVTLPPPPLPPPPSAGQPSGEVVITP